MTVESFLPPGFRFFPTDEELLTCYLARKAVDASFTSATIRDVDLYSFDPWDLPCHQQQDCCYFFCTKGIKYSSGMRARRATRSGYWKSTGNDKAVYSSAGAGAGRLVGTKKTLVFYGGRAPRGKRTGWVMHEYALGDSAILRGAQSEWVICRVLMKKGPSSSSSDSWKLETEEMVHGCCDGEQGAPPPPPACSHRADSQSSSAPAVMDDRDGDDEKDRQDRQMAHYDDDLLMMNNSLLHDGQLESKCSALQFMQMQSNDVDFSLPVLLDYDDGYGDLLLNQLDTGVEMDRHAETSAASVDATRLGGLYWDFDF